MMHYVNRPTHQSFVVSHMKQYSGINAVPSFNMMNEQLKCVANIMNAGFPIFPTSYPFPAAQGTTITAYKKITVRLPLHMYG